MPYLHSLLGAVELYVEVSLGKIPNFVIRKGETRACKLYVRLSGEVLSVFTCERET